jgi:hypothetical protein
MVLAAERGTALQAGRSRARCNEDQGIDGKILTWIFRMWDMDEVWTGWNWLRIGTGGELL